MKIVALFVIATLLTLVPVASCDQSTYPTCLYKPCTPQTIYSSKDRTSILEEVGKMKCDLSKKQAIELANTLISKNSTFEEIKFVADLIRSKMSHHYYFVLLNMGMKVDHSKEKILGLYEKISEKKCDTYKTIEQIILQCRDSQIQIFDRMWSLSRLMKEVTISRKISFEEFASVLEECKESQARSHERRYNGNTHGRLYCILAESLDTLSLYQAEKLIKIYQESVLFVSNNKTDPFYQTDRNLFMNEVLQKVEGIEAPGIIDTVYERVKEYNEYSTEVNESLEENKAKFQVYIEDRMTREDEGEEYLETVIEEIQQF